MYRPGHVGAALLAYSPIAFAVATAGYRLLVVAGACLAVGVCMLPDVDQRLPGVAHRGPTHTVWFAVVVGVVAAVVVGVAAADGRSAAVAVLAADMAFVVAGGSVLSHIAADALTPAGVAPFAPVSRRRYSLGWVTASNPVANYLLLAVGGVVVLAAVGVGVRVGAIV